MIRQRPKPISTWLGACVALLGVVLLAPEPARAADEEPSAQSSKQRQKLGVLQFAGEGADEAQAAVAESLGEAGYELGQPDASLGGNSSDEELVAAAREGGLSALVVGKLVKQKAGLSLVLSVLNGADAQSLGTTEFEAPSAGALRKVLVRNAAGELEPMLADARAPKDAEPEPEPEDEAPEESEPAEPEPEPEPEPEDESASTAGEPHRVVKVIDFDSAIEVLLGGRGFSRNYEYQDAIPGLPEYSLGGAPALFIQARIYPLAFSEQGLLGHLGLTGGFEQGIALTSTYPDGRELKSSSRSFFAGVRGRIPLEAHELGLGVAYGQHQFEVTGDEDAPLVPDVDYRFVRVGLDGRFRVSSLVFGFQLARRFLMDTGELESDAWFPNLTGGGLEAGVFAGTRLSPSFDLLLGFDVHRYFFDLNPSGSDRILSERGATAGGAVDQYLSGWLGVNWTLPDK